MSKIGFSIWIFAIAGMLVAWSSDGLSDRRAKEGHGLLARPSTDGGTLIVGNREQEWKAGATLMVPARVPIHLANPTNRELIVRLHILEGK